MEIDDALVRDVDLLCLDAGNTVIFLDHARLAAFTGGEASSLVRFEGEAKRLAESGGLFDVEWTSRDAPGAASWGRMVGTIARLAGVADDAVPAVLDAAWADHVRLNLWCRVPADLEDALALVRSRGVKVCIVSNSEGMLDRLFAELGILASFDAVIDSGKVGVEKPDPRIFDMARERFGAAKERTLHLGDVFATDIAGARAAGIRHALIDPFGHYEGRHLDVPRVPGAPEVARAIAERHVSAS